MAAAPGRLGCGEHPRHRTTTTRKKQVSSSRNKQLSLVDASFRVDDLSFLRKPLHGLVRAGRRRDPSRKAEKEEGGYQGGATQSITRVEVDVLAGARACHRAAGDFGNAIVHYCPLFFVSSSSFSGTYFFSR